MEEKYEINGKTYSAVKVDMFGVSLMIIKARSGFLACGYVNIELAEKLGHAGAIVSGVKCFDDMAKASIKACSSEASKKGVEIGMSGEKALELLDA